MKKLQKFIFASVSILSIASCSLSYAGNRPGAATFTVGGGKEFFADKRNLDNAGFLLVGLGWDFTQNWGISAILAGLRTHFNDSVNDDRRVSGTLFAVDGVYHFAPPTRLQMIEPYLMLGVGITGLNPNGNSANNEGNINAGAGLQWFVQRSIALQAEVRDFYTIVGGKNDVLLDAGINVLFDFC